MTCYGFKTGYIIIVKIRTEALEISALLWTTTCCIWGLSTWLVVTLIVATVYKEGNSYEDLVDTPVTYPFRIALRVPVVSLSRATRKS